MLVPPSKDSQIKPIEYFLFSFLTSVSWALKIFVYNPISAFFIHNFLYLLKIIPPMIGPKILGTV